MLYLGRIDIFGKGLDLLLEAYSRHSQEGPAMDLVIAGDGRDMDKFRKMVAGLPAGIRGRIKLTGWVSGREKTETIRDASLLLLPSRHEVQGISVLEAMAAGKAVIASDIPELSYVGEGQAGISFASGDAASLAAAMSEMRSEALRRQMGMNGRAWVRDLSWENIAARFEEFLMTVANMRSSK
jgi:glycosyltransferase involved in cell wall biosynthesis